MAASDNDRQWEALTQAWRVGYLWTSLRDIVAGPGPVVWATIAKATVVALRADERFVEGPLSLLHDVGEPKTEFRSVRGSLGRGSLQVVVNTATGRCALDVDRFSPYDDVVGFLGHTGEVLRGWWRRVWA